MRLLVSVLAVAAVGCMVRTAAAEKVDSGLYTLYQISEDGRKASFTVCGILDGGDGCYGGGGLEKLDRACAIMEGKPRQQGEVITRDIYVFDKRSSSDNPAMVNVYVRTDDFSGARYTISVKLKRKIQAGIAGAPNANCYMAGSDFVIVVGTDASQTTAKIGLNDAQVSQIDGETNVQSITADQRGFITVSLLGGASFTLDPHGTNQGGGGGNYEMANTRNAFTTNPSSPRHRAN